MLSQLLIRFRRSLQRRGPPASTSVLVQLLIVLQLSQALANPMSSFHFRPQYHSRRGAAAAQLPSGLPPFLHRQTGLRQPSSLDLDLDMLSRQTYRGDTSPEDDLTVKKRSRTYVELRCGGIYDQSMFAKLEQVCDDCFNLYKEPQVHGMCR